MTSPALESSSYPPLHTSRTLLSTALPCFHSSCTCCRVRRLFPTFCLSLPQPLRARACNAGKFGPPFLPGRYLLTWQVSTMPYVSLSCAAHCKVPFDHTTLWQPGCRLLFHAPQAPSVYASTASVHNTYTPIHRCPCSEQQATLCAHPLEMRPWRLCNVPRLTRVYCSDSLDCLTLNRTPLCL